MIRLSLALLPLAALAACAPGNCDPSTAGFLSGIGCETSGSYGVRQNQLQTNLASARADLAAQRNRANYAAIDAGQAQSEQAGLSRRLGTMARENAALRTRLNAAERRQGVDQQAVRQQQADLTRLERDRAAAASGGATPAQLGEMERRRQVILDAAAGL